MSKEKSKAADLFARLGDELRQDGRLQIDQAKLELSEQVFQLMQDQGVTEAELARRLGSSRAYVNKILQGDTNFTIESLIKIGLALDCELTIGLEKASAPSVEDGVQISYVVEEPIAEPKVVNAAGGTMNVVSFGDYRAARKIEIGTTAVPRDTRLYASL